ASISCYPLVRRHVAVPTHRAGGTPMTATPPAHAEHSPQEWKTRVELAAAYRAVHHWGWTSLIFNHITARVDGDHEHFLINDYGLMYDEVTASNLVKLDLAGNIIEGPPDASVNLAGYVIHSAIHAARPDVRCIAHTHTIAGVAVSAMEEGLLP